MLKTQKVSTGDLRVGMYVSSLDRPWLGTPFITQGFVIADKQDLYRLQKYCEYVHVDFRRSTKLGGEDKRLTLDRPGNRPVRKDGQSTPEFSEERPRIPMEKIFKGRTLKSYRDDSNWEEENPRAQQALSTLILDIDDIF